jgi:MATE family multidrug resistance protein
MPETSDSPNSVSARSGSASPSKAADAGEFRALFRIAGPVILAEVGWMGMGLVDTVMVGPLGPAAIAATGMGSTIFFAIAVFGMGLMLGIDALVARAYGAGRIDEGVAWLHQGVWLACLAGPVVMTLAVAAYYSVSAWGLHPEIRVLLQPYLAAIAPSALPLLLYAVFRRYLQGLHVVTPIMVALLTANAINAAANWVLIYGNLGFPALGVRGSAVATTIARAYMALFLVVAIRRLHQNRGADQPRVPWRFDPTRVKSLIALGFPAAAQLTLEVGVFAAVTALAGRVDPIASASHQIALNIAALAFMVPLGLSSAGAVRVGHALGAGDVGRAVTAGWTALGSGAAVMTALGIIIFAFPLILLRPFTTDARVIELGASLLLIAAAFQLFDGTQAVATGVLRGLGDTRTPMLMNVIGHWALGLPTAYVLCFTFGLGVAGLWIGLSIGLVFTAITLTVVWARKSRLKVKS